MSRFYPGLMPWHLDRMSLGEVIEYVRQMDEALADQDRR